MTTATIAPVVALRGRMSDREWQVFMRLSEGVRVGDIAVELGISQSTVSVYRNRICAKFGFKTNVAMAHAAIHLGLVKAEYEEKA